MLSCDKGLGFFLCLLSLCINVINAAGIVLLVEDQTIFSWWVIRTQGVGFGTGVPAGAVICLFIST